MPELQGAGDCKIEKIDMVEKSSNAANLKHPAIYNSPSGCGVGAPACPVVDIVKTIEDVYSFKIRITQADSNTYTTNEIKIKVTSDPLCTTSFTSQLAPDSLTVWKQFTAINSHYTGVAATKTALSFIQTVTPIEDCKPKSISLVCRQY